MTVARVSQLPLEVVRANTDVKSQVSQLPFEIVRTNLDVKAQVSQLVCEVVRQQTTPAVTTQPIITIIT